MFNVNVTKTNKPNDAWDTGMIRMSSCGKNVIMVVFNQFNARNCALILKHESNFHIGVVDTSPTSYWIEKCPIILENISLEIKGEIG